MSVTAIKPPPVSPLMPATAVSRSKEREKQPKISDQVLGQPRPSVSPVSGEAARAAAVRELDSAKSKLEQVYSEVGKPANWQNENIKAEVLKGLLESARGNHDRARGHVDALSLATTPSLAAEGLAADKRHQVHNLLNEAESWGSKARHELSRAIKHKPRGADPLLNVSESSIGMAKAVGEIMNHYSWRLDRNTASVQKLTELRGILEHYKDRDKVDFTNPENATETTHFARIQELLPVARQNRVLWPEGAEGWDSETEREGRIQGLDHATQSLSKTGEQLTLRLQFAQNTYNQHLMNAAYAAQRQAKIIDLIMQLLARS